jgi:hypothetical protein
MMRHPIRCALHTVCLAVGTLAVSGCAYRLGSLMHPQIETVAIDTVANLTDQPQLTAQFKDRLAMQFLQDGSVRISTPDQADAVVRGCVVSVSTERLASAERRDDDERDADSEAYQTTVYRTTVVVEYELRQPGRASPVIPLTPVRGSADFAGLPDLEIARQAALAQAVNDAAKAVVTGITEAW